MSRGKPVTIYQDASEPIPVSISADTGTSVAIASAATNIINANNVATASAQTNIIAANREAVASAQSAIIVQVASAQSAIIVQVASSETNIIAANREAVASAQSAIIVQVASSETNIKALLPMDTDYNCRPIIDVSHERIHQGLLWSTTSYQTGTTAMNVLITAPSAGTGIHYHFVAEVAMTGAGTVTWSKTPNFDSTGSAAIVAYNHNEDHAASNLSTLTHVLGGVWTSSGTLLAQWLVGTATGNPGQPLVIGGGGSHAHEWELGYDSVHLIRATFAGSCESCIRQYYYRQA